jgi:conjugal transfer/entry exclusion protein
MSNSHNVSLEQLKRAVAIREQIDSLQTQLDQILGEGEPIAEPSASGKKRTMSPSARRKIAAAQRLRWAKLKGSTDTKPAKRGRRKMSAAVKAKIAAAARARWAKVHASGKNRL